MSEMNLSRIDHPAAWTSAKIGGKEGLMHRMGPEHIAALKAIVERTRHKAPHEVTREEAADPVIDALMTGVRYQIMDGMGAIILAGLDMAETTLDDYQRMYWALGTHLGVGAVQSYRGDRIGYVQKEKDNPTGRGYLMDIELRSHTDFHEILSLASVRKSATGGESGLVSSLAIHNAILHTRPELLAPLYDGFYHASSGDAVTNDKVPIFCDVDGKVSCYYHNLFMVNAARKMGIEYPPELQEALDYFTELAASPALRADFMLEPGEMMFWHNFTALHSRAAFDDTEEQKRLLLRLWLNVPDGRPMDPHFTARARYMDEMHESGRAAIDYAKAGELTMSLEALRRDALKAAPADYVYRRITVEPLTGALGAEIKGADLTEPLDDELREEILAAFDRHLVIWFHGQAGMTPEQHIAFASMFGPLQKIPHINSIEGYPDVQIVRRQPEEKTLYIGEGFHADSTFIPTPPTTVTMRAVEVPEYGGDTAFANMYLAYETLSAGLQETLRGLKGVHSAAKVFGSKADQSRFTMKTMDTEEGDREVVHPLVRTHPRTGRKSLFINRTYLIRIDGWTEAESQPLLDYLRAHAAHIAYTCRVRWRNDMVLVWDNRCTHHSAIGDYNAYRYLERVTTGGEVPV